MLPICVRTERVWPTLSSIQGIRANLVYIVSLIAFQRKQNLWPQCTLIRGGGIVIQPGLNINYSLHHSAFLSYFLSVVQISTIEKLVLCTVGNFVHYYKFQLLHAFFHVIIDQFEFFLWVGKTCNYCCILQDTL